ncbi:MAG: 50S ribosomal protein L10 [Vampirovibrionales bacterium]
MPTLAKKQEQVEALTQAIADANIILVADYRGLTVAEMTALRVELRKVNVKLTVAKNTLVKRASSGTDVENLAPHLKGPTSLVLGYGDQIAAVKVVKEFLKKNKKQNELRAGFLEGSVFNAVGVEELAGLPSADEMRGKLLMCIAYPVTGIVSALNSAPSAFVRSLQLISETKPQG